MLCDDRLYETLVTVTLLENGLSHIFQVLKKTGKKLNQTLGRLDLEKNSTFCQKNYFGQYFKKVMLYWLDLLPIQCQPYYSVKEMLLWKRSRTQTKFLHSTAAAVTHEWCVPCIIVACLFFQIILVEQNILLQPNPLCSDPCFGIQRKSAS